MKIHIGADHAGFEMKQFLIQRLEGFGHTVDDYGAYEYDPEDDYPDFIKPVAQAVSQASSNEEGEREMGIVIGGSGQGEAICANRFPGVRAAVFNGQYDPIDENTGELREVPSEIILSREHNDSNILSLGARFLTNEEALEAVLLWLETDFSGDERHVRRLEKIES